MVIVYMVIVGMGDDGVRSVGAGVCCVDVGVCHWVVVGMCGIGVRAGVCCVDIGVCHWVVVGMCGIGVVVSDGGWCIGGGWIRAVGYGSGVGIGVEGSGAYGCDCVWLGCLVQCVLDGGSRISCGVVDGGVHVWHVVISIGGGDLISNVVICGGNGRKVWGIIEGGVYVWHVIVVVVIIIVDGYSRCAICIVGVMGRVCWLVGGSFVGEGRVIEVLVILVDWRLG